MAGRRSTAGPPQSRQQWQTRWPPARRRRATLLLAAWLPLAAGGGVGVCGLLCPALGLNPARSIPLYLKLKSARRELQHHAPCNAFSCGALAEVI